MLDRDDAKAAVASIHEIAEALKANLKDQGQAAASVGAAQDAAGIATFFAYLHAAGLFAGARELAFQYLEIGSDALAGQPMGPSLYGGFTGIAWAVQHVNGLLSGSSDDLCGEIDLALAPYLGRSPWKADYDLIGGLVGLGVYCLERADSPVAIRSLELIVERLSELAEPEGDGLRWLTGPNLLPPQQRDFYPQGYYNLGLAHGVPGIIALLGKIQAAGIAQQRAAQLLEGAVRWLLRQQLSDSNSSFASLVCPQHPPKVARLAWCYGDAGLAAALLLAARSAGHQAWEQQALAIARKAAVRDPQTAGIIDACFCHGSSGLAHVFNRFYRATHDQVFAQAAHYWLEKTLQLRKPSAATAGYLFMAPTDTGEFEFHGRLGMLEGIAGVGLSLLAAVTSIEPCWDRIFMTDVPPLSES